MNPGAPRPGIARATVLGFAAEALVFPAGLITAAYLTRALGAITYGQISLVYAVISPIMWIASTIFAGRAAIALLAGAGDWRAIAAALLRANMFVGLGAMLLFALAVPLVGSILPYPDLVPYFWLGAVEIALMPITRLHRDALTARGRYAAPALATLAYQIARLVLILGLVAAGWSIAGVIAANIGARVLELVSCRAMQPLPFRGGRPGVLTPVRQVLGSVFVYALCLQLFNRVDLLMIGSLGTADAIGHYAAAQNLAQAPGLFALVFSPLLIAALRRAEAAGAAREVEELKVDSARIAVALWAFSAPVAAGSSRLAPLLFGPSFEASGPILGWLGIGGGAALVLSVLSAHELASGHHRRPLLAAIPMLTIAIVLHVMLIPRYGGLGAAVATATAAVLAALLAQGFRGMQLLPSRAIDLLRALVAGAVGLAGTSLAAMASVPSPLDIAAGCLATALSLVALGLMSTQYIRRVIDELAGRPALR